MVNNQLKIYIKKGSLVRKKNTFEREKNKPGLNWVLPGHPGHGSTRFHLIFVYPSLLSYLNRSNHRVPH